MRLDKTAATGLFLATAAVGVALLRSALVHAQTDGSGTCDAGIVAIDSGPTLILDAGTVVDDGGVTCPLPDSGVPRGAVCSRLIVQCPGLPDLAVTTAVTEPAGATNGTIVIHGPGPGNHYYNPNDTPEGGALTSLLLDAGFRTVQLAWDDTWWGPLQPDDAGSSILQDACRPAALFQWAFATPHGGHRDAGFCGLGSSAGSGAFSYALSHYGESSFLDFVLLVAGPPFGRIDIGCEPGFDAGTIRLCACQASQLADAPYHYGGAQTVVGEGEGTPGVCGLGDAGATTISHWQSDSVVSAGGDYSYPHTPVDFWYCANAPNETTGLGSFFYDQISTTKRIHCVIDGGQGGWCTGENVFQDNGAFVSILSSLETNCVARH
jgi:hypothetical protein